jgi:hypothetical protein
MDGNLPADTIYVGQALVKFKEEYTTFKDLAPKVFSRWIQSYLEYANVEYHKGRESRGTYFQLDINNTDIHSMLYD